MGDKIGWSIHQVVDKGDYHVSPTDLQTDFISLMEEIRKIARYWRDNDKNQREGRVGEPLLLATNEFVNRIKGI
jgi:hypothetical protein